jgi:hypothetical protein
MQVPNWFSYPSIFLNVREILVMANDVVTPLNPLIALVEQKDIEEISFDMNVSQRPHEVKSSKRVVHT